MASTNGQHDKSEAAAERLKARAQETVDTIAERARRAEGEVRSAAERTAEHARHLRDEYSEAAEQHMRRAKSYVHSNPFAFAGIAFVAGVLLSTLLRR